MASSDRDRLFHRQTTLHQILGGGLVADVILWRRKNVTMNILWLTLAAWFVFQRSGYTLLSFVSSVCLLLFTILFLWSRSAAILNRPAPPLPELYLSEEMVDEAAALIRKHVNFLLSRFQDIALGKDSRLFFRVALYLLFICIVGGLTDFLTFGYATLVITLTIPALYERYEDHIDSCIMTVYRKLLRCYYRFNVVCLMPVHGWMLEKKKLS